MIFSRDSFFVNQLISFFYPFFFSLRGRRKFQISAFIELSIILCIIEMYHDEYLDVRYKRKCAHKNATTHLLYIISML
jgi:hypothetical protein